jgi:hypothetical protein
MTKPKGDQVGDDGKKKPDPEGKGQPYPALLRQVVDLQVEDIIDKVIELPGQGSLPADGGQGLACLRLWFLRCLGHRLAYTAQGLIQVPRQVVNAGRRVLMAFPAMFRGFLSILGGRPGSLIVYILPPDRKSR